MKYLFLLPLGLFWITITLSSCEKEGANNIITNNCGDIAESMIVAETDSNNFEFAAAIHDASDELTYDFISYKEQLQVEISVGPGTNTDGNSIGISSVKGKLYFVLREKESKTKIYSKTVKGIVAIDETVQTNSNMTYEAVIQLECFDGRVAIEIDEVKK
jgi:hypothetical protein